LRDWISKVFRTATWGGVLLRYRRLRAALRDPKAPGWGEDEAYELLLFPEGVEHPDLPGGGTNVEVRLPDGSRWGAALYTPEEIRAILDQWRRSDERSGLYFWAPGVLIVRDLAHGSVAALVEDLISTGEFEEAFVRLS
jgi:hypothetical protein